MAGITNYFDNEDVMLRVEEYISNYNVVFNKKEPLTFIQFLHNINDKNFTWGGVCRFCANYNPDGGCSCSITVGSCKEETLWHIVNGERRPRATEEFTETFDKIHRDAAEKVKEMEATAREKESESMEDNEKERNFFDNEEVMSRAKIYVEELNERIGIPFSVKELIEEISEGRIPHLCCSFCRKYKIEDAEDLDDDDCSFVYGTCKEEIIWHIVKGDEITEDEEEFESIIAKAQRDAAEKVEERRREMEAEDILMEFQQDTVDNPVNISSDPMVEKPTHYTSGAIECIDAIAAATKDLNGIEAFDTGNAIKYLWRWKKKNGKQDLEKARWYVNHLIAHIEKAEEAAEGERQE